MIDPLTPGELAWLREATSDDSAWIGPVITKDHAARIVATLDRREQEVRDDIRARVEALDPTKYAHDGTDVERLQREVLAAISSSSATETQGLTHREQLAYKAGELAGREAERLGVSVTETQDGERHGHESEWWSGCADHVHPNRDCGYCSSKFHRFCASSYATPSPDDRDREVECVSCDDDHDANIHDHHWHDLDKTTYIGMEHGRELTDSEDAAENATWD